MKKNILIINILIILCSACNRIHKHATLIENFPASCTLQGDSIRNFDNELGIMAILNAGNYLYAHHIEQTSISPSIKKIIYKKSEKFYHKGEEPENLLHQPISVNTK